uniref:alpha-amylase family glycosyl hydrolase n=1 Tax=Microbacterium sp. CPCC 204701 TaxID=2493084 RepID=UPI000FDC4F70
AAALRGSIQRTLAEHEPVGAPATWVLSNHDVTRPATRYGRADSSFAFARKRFGIPTDLARGTRRARAAAMLAAALPGSMYIYQGDELGLPEVELPREVIEDPMHFRSEGVDPGRDGCRVPLPWSGSRPPYGFGAAATWLPQPPDWAPLTVEAQEDDAASMLALYREALRVRRAADDLRGERLSWLELGADVLAFRRGERTVSMTNFGSVAVPLPAHRRLLLASAALSGPGSDDVLPPDSTVWLEL